MYVLKINTLLRVQKLEELNQRGLKKTKFSLSLTVSG